MTLRLRPEMMLWGGGRQQTRRSYFMAWILGCVPATAGTWPLVSTGGRSRHPVFYAELLMPKKLKTL